MTMEMFREHYDGETLRAVPVLTLAHVGDGVYELLARTEVLSREILRVEDAHRRTVELVTAPAQARAALEAVTADQVRQVLRMFSLSVRYLLTPKEAQEDA